MLRRRPTSHYSRPVQSRPHQPRSDISVKCWLSLFAGPSPVQSERRNVCHSTLIIAWLGLTTTSGPSTPVFHIWRVKGVVTGGVWWGWLSLCLSSTKPQSTPGWVLSGAAPALHLNTSLADFPTFWDQAALCQPAHTDIDIIPAEIINIIHSLFFGLTHFPTRWRGDSVSTRL